VAGSSKSLLCVLDPMERVAEILFGLIMVLTATAAVSVVTADQVQIRTMLIAALGCNLAWGIIDAGMYLMGCLHERGRGILAARAVRETADPVAARRIIADALPPAVAAVLPPEQLDAIGQRLRDMPAPPARPRLTARDGIGALGVCLLVFFATLPVAAPFLVIAETRLALRVSNAVAVAMLFLCGYAFGRRSGLQPLATGLAMVLVGGALVSVAIALGG
jgi:VIT1/CCC1 family predicted Fe2+/Mn2+ transporter